MVYDVISVGSAAVDVFIKSKSKDIEIERIHAHEDVCMPIGAKILIDFCCSGVGGSALNSSISFSRLGFKAGAVVKLGNDLNGQVVKQALAKEKVSLLGTISPGQTGYSVVLSGLRGNRTLLAYKGNNDKLGSEDVAWNKLKTKWFYFGTMLSKSWNTQCKIARYAKKNKINVLFNPSLYLAEKGEDFLHPVLDACSLLILNKEEARALTGINAGVKTLLKELQETVPLVVITDGPKGAHAYNGISIYSMVPQQIKVVDTTGAGDAFSSGFLAAIMRKHDIPTALKWGAAQANSVIKRYGATNKLLKRKELSKRAQRAGRVRRE